MTRSWWPTTASLDRDDRIIYRGKSVPERVSNHGIEAALKSCTSLSSATAFEARVEGHAFLVVNVPGVTTFALDLAAPKRVGRVGGMVKILRAHDLPGPVFGHVER